jgi:hypothetical protein
MEGEREREKRETKEGDRMDAAIGSGIWPRRSAAGRMVGGVEGMVGAYCGTGRGKKGGDRIVLFTAVCGWVATLVDGSLVGTEAGTHGVGEKKIRFCRNAPQIAIFLLHSPSILSTP